jgi:hypothetical protein
MIKNLNAQLAAKPTAAIAIQEPNDDEENMTTVEPISDISNNADTESIFEYVPIEPATKQTTTTVLEALSTESDEDDEVDLAYLLVPFGCVTENEDDLDSSFSWNEDEEAAVLARIMMMDEEQLKPTASVCVMEEEIDEPIVLGPFPNANLNIEGERIQW